MAPLEEAADPVAKPLKLGIGAFFIGLCGVVFGLVIDYGPNEPLSFVAFGIVALAVATAFVAIGWGWLSIFRHRRGQR
jgi:hypothetical protein